MKITDPNITSLEPNEIFVFGSNLSGRHGKGAAKTAMKWGAKYGQAYGLQGRTFGIPTVNASISHPLDIKKIAFYIDQFYFFVGDHPELHFLITEIGCGLVGLKPKAIAPLFKLFVKFDNVSLPKSFIRILQHEK